MLRSVLGVIVAAIAWLAAFYLLAYGLALAWDEYGVHGNTFVQERRFTFTPPMSMFNLLFWALAEAAGGWVAMKITRRLGAVWVLAAALTAYGAFNHLWIYWDRIPWWYNIAVVVMVAPSVLLGARLAGAATMTHLMRDG